MRKINNKTDNVKVSTELGEQSAVPMFPFTLTEVEQALILDILNDNLVALKDEIHQSDTPAFKHYLCEKKKLLEGVISKVSATIASSMERAAG